jgi:hypothetical protein
LAAIFVHEFAGLLYLTHFAGKSQGYAALKSRRPTSVHRRGRVLASSSIYPQDMLLVPLLPQAVAIKNLHVV